MLPAGSPDASPRYVVAAAGVAVAGKKIAQQGFLSLYRVKAPLGLATFVSGVQPDAWTGPSATYTSFRGIPGHRLNVLTWRPPITGPPPAHVTIEIGSLRGASWTTRRFVLPNGKRHLETLPVRSGPFRVQVMVSPTFVPTQYGLADTRTLGVQISFSLP